MIGLLKLFAGLVGVFWMAIAGGWAVYWWDRRPADVPRPVVLHLLVFHATFGLPPSLKARADAAGAELKADRDRAQAEAERLAAVADSLNLRAASAEARAQRVLRAQQAALVREIPDVLPPRLDARYPLPCGLVSLHDAAALGLPPAACGADDPASPVTASGLAAAFVPNYGECRADQERLSALQAWVRDLHAAGQAQPSPPR